MAGDHWECKRFIHCNSHQVNWFSACAPPAAACTSPARSKSDLLSSRQAIGFEGAYVFLAQLGRVDQGVQHRRHRCAHPQQAKGELRYRTGNQGPGQKSHAPAAFWTLLFSTYRCFSGSKSLTSSRFCVISSRSSLSCTARHRLANQHREEEDRHRARQDARRMRC